MKEIQVDFNKDRNTILAGDSWVYTDSLNVSAVLNVDHKEVMRKIRKVLVEYKIEDGDFSPPSEEHSINTDFIRRNTDFTYAISYYINSQNKLQPFYKLSKDLLVLTAFKFKSKKSLEFQLAYIAKFNEAEKELHWWRARYLGIDMRNKLTLAIKDYVENPTTNIYAEWTDRVYKTAFGMKSWKIRNEFGLKKKENIRPFLEKDSLNIVEAIERDVGTLLSFKIDFKEISERLQIKYPNVHKIKMKQSSLDEYHKKIERKRERMQNIT